MRRTRKKANLGVSNLFHSYIYIFITRALLTCMKSLVKGKIEKDMFSKAWANAKTITPMIFS